MTDPGWYHAAGDPQGTVRYWTGATWQGEPTTQSAANSTIYYAAAPDSQIDLGDVAVRKEFNTSAEFDTTAVQRNYEQSPFSVNTTSVNVKRRKRFPEGLKNLTVLVSVLKALPIFLIGFELTLFITRTAMSDTSLGRYAPPGFDLDSTYAVVVMVYGIMLLGGALLLIAQGRAALDSQPGTLFAVATLLALLDIVFMIQAFADSPSGLRPRRAFLIMAVLGLQALVALWSGKLASQR